MAVCVVQDFQAGLAFLTMATLPLTLPCLGWWSRTTKQAGLASLIKECQTKDHGPCISAGNTHHSYKGEPSPHIDRFCRHPFLQACIMLGKCVLSYAFSCNPWAYSACMRRVASLRAFAGILCCCKMLAMLRWRVGQPPRPGC